MQPRTPTALIILDGWGYREQSENNAIALAKPEHWEKLYNHHPSTLISGSGTDVGLPEGQMGNSEVGHMNIGAGRVLHQDLTRINDAISDHSFRKNPVLSQAIEHSCKTDSSLHILGLLSPGGVHSQEHHIAELCQWAVEAGVKKIYLHAFLDGRDCPPKSAEPSLTRIEKIFNNNPEHRIATMIGRFYAMDRDKRWERVQKAYDLLTQGTSEHKANSAKDALNAAYERGETDEFIEPTVIGNAAAIESGDSVVFMNFRADRARELTQAFTEPDFDGFQRQSQPNLNFITLTEYEAETKATVAFPVVTIDQTLGHVFSENGLTQLRIAETEKYAHVTFFMNGGSETVFPGEERILVPSPTDVKTYDEKPQMSAPEMTDKLVEAIKSAKFDAIICNFANTDMVGHTGNLPAAIEAVETVDACLKRITEALSSVGGQCLITADHGNAELMLNPKTGQPHTAHTCEPVPLVYFGPKKIRLKAKGILADVAPTMLGLMGIDQPSAMTGKNLTETL